MYVRVKSNIHPDGLRLLSESQDSNCLYQVDLWTCLWDTALVVVTDVGQPSLLRRALFPWQAVVRCIGKLAEHKPVSQSAALFHGAYFQVAVLISLSDKLWPGSVGQIILFPPQGTFGQRVLSQQLNKKGQCVYALLRKQRSYRRPKPFLLTGSHTTEWPMEKTLYLPGCSNSPYFTGNLTRAKA